MNELEESQESALEENSVPVPASAAGGLVSHAIFRVARLHRMRASMLGRDVALHPAQEMVMMELWDRGGQRQIDLARLVDSDAAAMTRIIQRLEHSGYVRRSALETDRRVTIIEPTKASLALRPIVESLWRQLEDRTIADLTPAERDVLLSLLERVEKNLAS